MVPKFANRRCKTNGVYLYIFKLWNFKQLSNLAFFQVEDESKFSLPAAKMWVLLSIKPAVSRRVVVWMCQLFLVYWKCRIPLYERFYKLPCPRPAIGAQAWFCMDKNAKSALGVEYGISDTRETTSTLTLPCGDLLLASSTAVPTFSTLEDWICFRPLPGRMASCPVL